MPKKLSEDIINTAIEYYKSGMTVKDAASSAGISKTALVTNLSKRGISRKEEYRRAKEFSDSINKSNIVLGSDEITDMHHIRKSLEEYLSNNNVPSINNNGYSKDEEFFDSIDDQYKAYILGFLYADGCNMPEKSTITISLEEKDGYILEMMRRKIQSTKPLEFVKQSERLGNNNSYNYKDLYSLRIYSKHMCESLSKVGVVKNKSLVLKFPTWLDCSLYSHFIRGYFDGDGSISFGRSVGSIVLSFTSTQDFCEDLRSIIYNMCPNAQIIDASCHNGVTRVLQISRQKEVLMLCDWMYKDAQMFLTRKYDRYVVLKKYLQIKNVA